MRLWSVSPKYLDKSRLIACWREALCGQRVLLGYCKILPEVKGYKNHSAWVRFKNYNHPILAISYYLNTIYDESRIRNYNFNKDLIYKSNYDSFIKIPVTSKQVLYESNLLLKKLQLKKENDIKINLLIEDLKSNKIELNNTFYQIDGKIEKWEKIHEKKIIN